MHARIRSLALFAAVLLSPAIGNAQQTARAIPAGGPRLEATVTGMRLSTQSAANSGVTQRRGTQSVGKPVALMIVGGAALVLGLIIGDDVGTLFAIGGAVAFLIGLYHYLK